MASWTAADIPDLTSRVAVVTGANSGLGFETARALAAHGATVVLGCRDESRCAAAAGRLGLIVPPTRIEASLIDLADLDSVRTFAANVRARHETIDILVNNAGVMAPPRRLVTKQGFELQFGTNHLGHFALTGLLLPWLVQEPSSRIVTVSSFAHERGRIDFDDLQWERNYAPYGAYGASKLANVLFMLELDRHLRRAGVQAISVGAHPGFTSTRLQAVGPFIGTPRLTSWLVLAGVRTIGQLAAEGAEPQLYAAAAPDVRGGEYFGPKWQFRGHPTLSTMAPQARDERVAARLWDVSKRLTCVDIDEAIHRGRSAKSSR